MSYAEYLKVTGKKDCRNSWVDWKTEIYNMDYTEARKISYDLDWGYEPITE